MIQRQEIQSWGGASREVPPTHWHPVAPHRVVRGKGRRLQIDLNIAPSFFTNLRGFALHLARVSCFLII